MHRKEEQGIGRNSFRSESCGFPCESFMKKKILSLFLIGMLFCSVPTAVHATEVTDTQQADTQQSTDQQDTAVAGDATFAHDNVSRIEIIADQDYTIHLYSPSGTEYEANKTYEDGTSVTFKQLTVQGFSPSAVLYINSPIKGDWKISWSDVQGSLFVIANSKVPENYSTLSTESTTKVIGKPLYSFCTNEFTTAEDVLAPQNTMEAEDISAEKPEDQSSDIALASKIIRIVMIGFVAFLAAILMLTVKKKKDNVILKTKKEEKRRKESEEIQLMRQEQFKEAFDKNNEEYKDDNVDDDWDTSVTIKKDMKNVSIKALDEEMKKTTNPFGE